MRSFVRQYLFFFPEFLKILIGRIPDMIIMLCMLLAYWKKVVYIIIKDLKNSKTMLKMCLTKHSGYHLNKSRAYMYLPEAIGRKSILQHYLLNL